MPFRIDGRRSLFLLPLFVSLAACGGATPSPAQNASPPPQASSQAEAGQAPLTGAVTAPGSERIDPDPHPELAHLTSVSTDVLAQSITNYVQTEAARHGGEFPVNDPAQQTTLGLTLTTVHRERLSQLADDRYFACADFKGRDGHTYDVDIFMRRESTGLTPTEIIVHKQDGKPRFDWVERNGRWAQVPVRPQ